MLKYGTLAAALLLGVSGAFAIAQDDDRAAIVAAVNDNPHRTAEQMARDRYRHPVETLAFFGIGPEMTVAEALPGWYTEILGPLLRERGTYLAIRMPPDDAMAERAERSYSWRDTFIDGSGKFGRRAYARFQLQQAGFAAPDSVDAVLMIRAFHGVIYDGLADEALDEIYRVLKPGGILGIVQHREDEASPNTPYDRRGYLKQSYVIGLVENAGFELVETSEINPIRRTPRTMALASGRCRRGCTTETRTGKNTSRSANPTG